MAPGVVGFERRQSGDVSTFDSPKDEIVESGLIGKDSLSDAIPCSIYLRETEIDREILGAKIPSGSH